METLVEISYSPWSEKARFALDHHRRPYRRETYKPMVGEIPLRARTGKWRGRLSVPVLLTGHGALFDSFEIAKHADAGGGASSLFPAAHREAIAHWNETSEAALAVGRKLALVRSLGNADAQKEGLKGVVPDSLRDTFRPLAVTAVRFIEAKYGSSELDPAPLEAALVSLRDALAKSGGDYLLGGAFTYADVTMAVVLQCVLPPESVRMSPGIRATFTDRALADRFPDLVAWRDRTYAKHR
jgi:glutathione S-transferase